MKIFIKTLSMLFACLLLCCGCTQNPQNTNATIYCANTQKDGFIEKQAAMKEFSAQGLVDALAVEGVLPAGITVHNFQKSVSSAAESTITLDLSTEFSQYITGKNMLDETIIIGCVTNTFLSNYGADKIFITVDDQIVKTNNFEYSNPLSYYEFSDGKFGPRQPDLELPTPGKNTGSPSLPSPSPVPTPSKSTESGKKHVALTFDDGPHTEYTKKIVDTLTKYGASATFFIVGNRVNNEDTRSAVRYASEKGNEIAIHGYTHKVFYHNCTDQEYKTELEETAKVIEDCTGKRPVLMRPIGGNITKERIASCPYSVIMWNVDSEDWKNKGRGSEEAAQKNIQATVKNVITTVKDGSIILMHEIYQNSYEALDLILDQLYKQGYEVVSVSELLGEQVKPGTRHSCR